MGLGEARINLHGIGILDRGLAVLAFVEVFSAALEIFLFANVGIARASGGEKRDQKAGQQQADGNKTAHRVSPVASTE